MRQAFRTRCCRPTGLRCVALAAGLAATWPCATLAGTAAAGRATLEILPALAGDLYSNALGLNDLGQAVGNSWDAALNRETAVIWQAGSGVQAIAGSTALGNARAIGINNAGLVVGSSASGAFSWQAGVGLKVFDGSSSAYAINGNGRIAGSVNASPARWQGAAAPEQLSSLAGEALGINAAGDTVGTTYAASGQAAMLWTAGGQATDLGRLSSMQASEARGINNLGQVAGIAALANSDARAFVWQASLGMQDLGTLGGSDSRAYALNDAGQVVGSSSLGNGQTTAMIWRAGTGMNDLSALAPSSFHLQEAYAINSHAQVVGTGLDLSRNNLSQGFLLTLHPDWNGGNGNWDDATGTHWNWGGTGTAAALVGVMHDVVINPGNSATVYGSANGQARNLTVGGTDTAIVTLQLNQGTTSVLQSALIDSGGVLRGSGRLASQTLYVVYTARVEVGAGEFMQLAQNYTQIDGLVRVQGTAAAPAQLEMASTYDITATGKMQFMQANVNLLGSGSNAGQLALQNASVDFSAAGLDNAHGAQIGISFGNSTINGTIRNSGLLVVSNGAQASFYGLILNTGELRVSAGGMADFFGSVLSPGIITGTGQMRFEGDLQIGANNAALSVGPQVALAAGSRLLMTLGAAGQTGKISFAGAVTLEGGALALSWANGGTGTAGESFDLFGWTGGESGQFGSLLLPSLDSGLVWDTADLYAGGTLRISAVPEPAQACLLLAGLLGMGWRLNARRH